MNELVIYDGTLQHHGVLGMKWGVRRYQNKDGSLTSAGMKRYGVGSDGQMSSAGKKLYKADKKQQKSERKNFDYKTHEAYKNAKSSYKKASIANQYNRAKLMLGTRSSNKILYDVLVDGERYPDAYKKEFTKYTAKLLAAETAILAGTTLVEKGMYKYRTAKLNAKLASDIVGSYGAAAGLNTVKGGFTSGVKHVKAGKAFLKMAGY